MHTINDRINWLVSNNHKCKTKTGFAKEIGLSQPYLSQICSGDRVPSDRTISDICREFNVNEAWLRTGAGNPFVPVSRNEEIESFMNTIMHSENADFRRRLVAVLAKLDASEWTLLEQMAQKLAAEAKPGANLHVIKKAGRDGSFEETVLTDDEAKVLQKEYDSYPDVPDDL